MGKEEILRIKSVFSRLGLHPTYLQHEAVITSEDAAKTRGFELRQGIKALLFTADNDEWVIVDVPADKKADVKKIAACMKWSKGKTRMANMQEVLDKTGCEIGAVPPFGHKTHIPIIVDQRVYDNHESAFNIGLRTDSVKILTSEMKIVFTDAGAIEGEFAK